MCRLWGELEAVNLVYEWAKDVIDGMPTVTNMDVLDSNIKAESRQTGHWIKISPANIYECSECHKCVCTADIECYEFCHRCGADMRGEEE